MKVRQDSLEELRIQVPDAPVVNGGEFQGDGQAGQLFAGLVLGNHGGALVSQESGHGFLPQAVFLPSYPKPVELADSGSLAHYFQVKKSRAGNIEPIIRLIGGIQGGKVAEIKSG